MPVDFIFTDRDLNDLWDALDQYLDRDHPSDKRQRAYILRRRITDELQRRHIVPEGRA